MISLESYIFEKMENKITESTAYMWLYNTYKNLHNVPKTVIIESLDWFKNDVNVLKGFEKFIVKHDSTKTAWTYMANDDDFLDKSKIDNIIERLADYIIEKLN